MIFHKKCVLMKYAQIWVFCNMYSYLNAMNASPSSPPTMWTPPSGIERPRKKFLMSRAFADQGRFWSRMMTLMAAVLTVTYKQGEQCVYLLVFILHRLYQCFNTMHKLCNTFSLTGKTNLLGKMFFKCYPILPF